MIKLSTTPNERGTGIFTLAFSDEKGDTIVPTSSAWQLMRYDGTIINDRSFDNCPFSGTTVVISGDDLQLFDNDDKKRIFAVQATYSSNDLPLNDECMFKINALVSQR